MSNRSASILNRSMLAWSTLATCICMHSPLSARADSCGGTILSPADRAASDQAGSAIDAQNDVLLMGAQLDDNAEGVDAGAVYAYAIVNGTWTPTIKLVPSSLNAGDHFGTSINVNGSYVIMGADDSDPHGDSSGSAYIYQRSGNSWVGMQTISPGDGAQFDEFGQAVGLGTDWAIIGAPGHAVSGSPFAGQVYAYRRFDNNWVFHQAFTLPNTLLGDNFGCAIAASGNTFVAGASGAKVNGQNSVGKAMVWNATLISGNPFAANWSGLTLTANDGLAYDAFGSAVAMSGDYVFVSAPYAEYNLFQDAGAVYVFKASGLGYLQVGRIDPPVAVASGHFGRHIDALGDFLLVADDLGRIYQYRQMDPNGFVGPELYNQWTTPNGGSGLFGSSVGLVGAQVLVGDRGHDFAPGGDEGAVYVFGIGAADNCQDALSIGAGTFYGCTENATNDGSADCGYSASNKDVWYRVHGSAGNAGPWVADTIGSGFDTVISVHDDCPATPANEIDCDDDGAGNTMSRIHFTVQPGVDYFIRVTGYVSNAGSFQLNVQPEPLTCPADVAPQPNGDGMVNIDDLLAVINAWGAASGPADINHDSIVNIDDLLAVIMGWGACP